MKSIKIKLLSEDAIGMKMPAINGDAGYDIYSNEDLIIKAHSAASVKTGFSMEIPKKYWFEIMPKSGIATKNHVSVHNGVIDNGYRGEIVVLMYNHSNIDYKVVKGEKIAQGVIRKLIVPSIEIVDELSDTERGTSGFGSTGKK